MILRFILKNIDSFKNETEFNMFPSSKSHNHEEHKVMCDYAAVLRLSAIYGANGAGKSNLLNGISLLKDMISAETLTNIRFYNELPFKFDKECLGQPSEIAIEFFQNGHVFYYHIEFDKNKIYHEELYWSRKSKDIPIFDRVGSKLNIRGEFLSKGFNAQFIDALDRLVRQDMLLISFMGKYYSEEVPLITDAYRWFTDKLQVVLPSYSVQTIPFLMDSDSKFAGLVNSIIPEFNTGIVALKTKKEIVNEENIQSNTKLSSLVSRAKQRPGEPQVWFSERFGNPRNIIFEDGCVYIETLVPVHKGSDNEDVEMSLWQESDGTRRLIEYMPLLYDIIHNSKVYVVDEMERSIHPILIKAIISKLSHSSAVSGQLIFTTHESALLDQRIFRPDEIWFAQKDLEQATQLYTLSDYNIHRTANIENGYLNGRYGGIPFLSNLKDLNWKSDDNEEERL